MSVQKYCKGSSLVFVLAQCTLIILLRMGCTYLSLILSIAYSVGKGAWMDAQWERTDPLRTQKMKENKKQTDRLVTRHGSWAILQLRHGLREKSRAFGSPLGRLSSQLQPFNGKLCTDLEETFVTGKRKKRKEKRSLAFCRVWRHACMWRTVQ